MNLFPLLEPDRDLSTALPVDYDPALVVLSVGIAVFASYTAFLASERLSSRRSLGWLVTGSAALGLGVWAMHFIGMLAASLSLEVGYNIPLTLVSLVPVFLASLVALGSGSRGTPTFEMTLLRSIAMGAGIGAMHYIGMAAMRMEGEMRYAPGFVLLSVVAAVVLAYVSLRTKFWQAGRPSQRLGSPIRLIAASIMGFAISTMHYIGMRAVYFFPGSAMDSEGVALNRHGLAEIIGGAVLSLLALAVLAVYVSQTLELLSKVRVGEQKIRAILDNAGDGIVTIDSGGIVRNFNTAAERIFGYAAAEIVGNNVSALMPEPFSGKHDGYIQRFLDTGVPKIIGTAWNAKGLHRDGRSIDVELTVTALEVEGEFVFTALLRDITEKLAAEAELLQHREHLLELVDERTREVKEAHAELVLANRAKSEFLASMSREIRTPLNGVIGMTGILLNTDLGKEQRAYLENIRISGEALLSVIRDVLEFSKIETGEVDMDFVNFDLRSIVEEALDIAGPRAAEKGLEISFVMDRKVPIGLRGDPGRLRQVLNNLMDNAVNYTSEGEILVEVSLERRSETRPTIRFAVADTGAGIPKERVDGLFEPFAHADASEVSGRGGAGLGLAISKRLVELMGGKIGVESKEGSGSTFWFTAAFEKQPDSQVSKSRATPEVLRKQRILIVDDTDTNRRILAAYLSQWGCRHVSASDGDEALSLLRRAAADDDPFDIAVLDMTMPDMTGEDLAASIKSNPDLARTRLVMYASMTRQGDAARFEANGFAAYLVKPVKPAQLFDCLLAVCEGESAERSSGRHIVTQDTLQKDAERLRGKRTQYRILLAEDNLTNRLVAVAMLEKLGYRADVAANGREAVRMTKDMDYDAVLMDCQMPEMDGYAATNAIRRSEGESRHTPIIALTANALKGDRERCIAAGMDDYLAKPIRPEELAHTLDQWVARDASDPSERESDEADTASDAKLNRIDV